MVDAIIIISHRPRTMRKQSQCQENKRVTRDASKRQITFQKPEGVKEQSVLQLSSRKMYDVFFFTRTDKNTMAVMTLKQPPAVMLYSI